MLNKSRKGGIMKNTINMNVWGKDKELTLEDYQGLWESNIKEFIRLVNTCPDNKSFMTNTEQYKGIYNKFKQSRGHNHREPLTIIKMNRQQPLAVISLEHFFELLEKED